jgi:hypothetical protein
MTRLLEKGFAEAKKLTPEEQNALAERIVADLRDAEAWDRSFEQTTDHQWDRMADIVRNEIKSGETKVGRRR